MTDATTFNRWHQGDRKMGMGFILPCSDRSAFGGTPRFSDMLDIVLTAEAAGFDSVWMPDHFTVRMPDGLPERGVWEGWTTLAALAARTSKITLGVFVTCTSFRNPGIIAKMSESIDEISGGRFVLGMGAGWHQPEFDMYGIPFDYRVSRFDDAINIIAPLMRDGHADYQGRFFQANDASNLPRGPRADKGGVPILIGTNSPKMMNLTARFADVWNSDWHHDTSTVVPLLAALDQACVDVGRDPATLVKTAGSNIALTGYLGIRLNPIIGDTDAIAEQVNKFRKLGLRHYIAGLDPCTPKSVEEFARVVEVLDRTA